MSKRYIYIFEDEVATDDTGPTDGDMQAIEDGILQVIEYDGAEPQDILFNGGRAMLPKTEMVVGCHSPRQQH